MFEEQSFFRTGGGSCLRRRFPRTPGWDEDLAWLDRDPERETWLDRAREHDDSPLEVEYPDYTPLTDVVVGERFTRGATGAVSPNGIRRK